MNILKNTLLCLITLCASIQAEAPQNPEIRVQLSTASSLIPVYMGRFDGETSLDRNYLSQLESVLLFDLNNNGSTRALPINDQKEKVLTAKEAKECFSPKAWKSFGIAHVMKVLITGKTLSLDLFTTSSGSLKHFSDITLTGEIAHDRRQIHKLADGIHKSLFNRDGIASSRILFARQAKEVRADSPDAAGWASEIWECDWDGHNARQITSERSYCVTPVFIPVSSSFPGASDRFLYVSYKSGQPKIFLASLKEGVGRRLIDLRGNQLLPAISPQRDKVAFICDAAGRSDLFMQPFNPQTGEVGKPQQLFSYPHSTQASPTFSPDGTKVAFVSDKDRSMRIYVIPATGSGRRANPQLITKQNSENSCPSWSPDGRKLAYSAKTGGVRQIWIYDFATQEERQLTSGAGNKENPTWAADSLHLVFNSTDASSSELYVVNLNQPDAIRITKGQGKNHYPTWGPR
ncbi:MAG: Tol-Pal system protein TolB [Chlamydiales bacterium]|nr:Tol-Pal system protein TolB [Chlamydiales bacterium]